MATGHVMQTIVHKSRIRSGVDGKVAIAKTAQKPAIKKTCDGPNRDSIFHGLHLFP